jgi:hypothetical protein
MRSASHSALKTSWITCFASLALSLAAQAPCVDVLTGRYGVDRSGANLQETLLNIQNVNSRQFGKLFEREVDGDTYAQPLIKTGVNIPNVGVRDVVFVATVNNSVYAYDATSPSASKPYWHAGPERFGDPVQKSKVTDLPASQEYRNFANQLGIVATPVIDDKTSTLYVVAQSHQGDNYRFQLHALDLATGREKSEMNSPQTIEAEYNGNGVGSKEGKIRFQARKTLNRAGLLLVDGVIYLAFTTHLDGEPSRDAHGWIMAYSAATLNQLSALCTTPDGLQGGVWQSGAGLTAYVTKDAPPLIYAVSGNGSVGGRNFSQSLLQLYPGELLSVKQAFTPEDQAFQNDNDLDLSTGAVLLPDDPRVVTCDKEGKCYVVNRSTMKLVQEFQAGVNTNGGHRYPNIHGNPVVWKNPQNILELFVWAEEDFLRVFHFEEQRFRLGGTSTVRAPEMSMPGGMLSVSSNGNAAGSGIVWATVPISEDANQMTAAGIVRAFDASNIMHELWNSEQESTRDRLGMLAKFCPPVVAGGRVYVATFANGSQRNKLVVYGLLQS